MAIPHLNRKKGTAMQPFDKLHADDQAFIARQIAWIRSEPAAQSINATLPILGVDVEISRHGDVKFCPACPAQIAAMMRTFAS
jgi:hypothetical protein